MAMSAEFKPIRLSKDDEKQGRAHMRQMLGASWWRQRGRASWAGFAAEHALVRSVNAGGRALATFYESLECDLRLTQHGEHFDDAYHKGGLAVEVKTRTVMQGWTHPDMFNYIVVPMHQDREPIKKAADTVWFCWYSMDLPRTLWVLGYMRGVDEFTRRSVWYGPKEPLPRGGWAGDGGAYVIEVKQLRPFPDGMFREERDV